MMNQFHSDIQQIGISFPCETDLDLQNVICHNATVIVYLILLSKSTWFIQYLYSKKHILQ